MWPHYKYSLLLAFRSRYALLSGILGLGLILVALAAASFSGRQPQTITLDMGISFIRWILPFLALMLTQELICKDIERKTIYMYLAQPQSRWIYLLSRYCGIATLLCALLFALSVILVPLTYYAGMGYEQSTPVALGLPYFQTQFFNLLELLLILAVAFAIACISTTPNLVLLIGIGLTVAGRTINNSLTLLQQDGTLLSGATHYKQALTLIQYFSPDLAKLDIRAIALYNNLITFSQPMLLAIAINALLYTALFLSIACYYLNRREFD